MNEFSNPMNFPEDLDEKRNYEVSIESDQVPLASTTFEAFAFYP